MGPAAMTLRNRLNAVSPDIVALRAATDTGSKPHLEWYVGWAPEEDDGVHGRVVLGTLHAFGDNGGGEVTVAATVIYPKSVDPSNEEFADALIDSEALETIYDIAHIALRSILATINAQVEIKRKSPKPTMSMLERIEPAPDSQAEPEADPTPVRARTTKGA
jgi:hypothetical protein